MKVYLVKCCYYDFDECNGNDMLLGVYSSNESAIIARNEFVAESIHNASGLNNPAQQSTDFDGNPIVGTLIDDKLVYEERFVIEEWNVQ